MRRHAVPLVAFFVIILLVGAPPAAAQSKCTSQPGGGLMPTCNGAFWVTSAAELADATALLKVVANDISPINSAAQTINASVCDAQTADDRFGLSIFRLAAPKDIERCVTPASSSAPCTQSLVD
jgi:hypothetical protein